MNISIEPLEGKLTSFWKIVTIELYDDDNRQKLIEKYENAGLHEVALTLNTTFYCDCHHYIAYWDKECNHAVSMVMLNRIQRTRKNNRKNRKRKKTQNPQY